MALPSIGVRLNVAKSILLDAGIDIFDYDKPQYGDDLSVDMSKL